MPSTTATYRSGLAFDAVLVAALAVVPRIVYVVATSPIHSSDESLYRTLAVTLREDGTLGLSVDQPLAVFPPLYPLLLSLFVRDGAVWEPGVLVVQMLLGAGSAAVAFVVARRLAGRLAGWLSGLFVAAQVPMIKMTGHFLGETLAVFLLLATLLATVEAVRRPSRRWAAAAGATAALAALTRAATLPWLAAVPLLLLGSRPADDLASRRMAVRVGPPHVAAAAP